MRTKGFVQDLKNRDKEYRQVLESVDRALLDSMLILKRDTQIESLLREYVQGERQYLYTHHLLVPSDRGYTVATKLLGNQPVDGHVGSAHIQRIQEKIKSMGANVHRTIRQAVDYITQQERFLEEKLVQQQMQQYLQSSGTPQLSSASQDRLPAFAKDDPGLLSLHNMREELLRSLNSIG